MKWIRKLKKFAIEAVCGFVLWTAILTPYMVFVTQVTFSQYLSWLVMEAIIVPPVAIIVVNVTNKVVKWAVK